MILNGTEKSAFLLMSIGASQAAKILKNLTPFEVEELITAMVNIKTISIDKLNEILHECYNLATEKNTFNLNFSEKHITEMLSKSLGEKKGNILLEEALKTRNAKVSIEALNRLDSKQIARFLEDEHPQIITAILIHLNKNQASQILSFFNDEKRAQIISRIVEFQGIEESRLIELNNVINNLLKHKKLILSEKGGVKTAVKILNSMPIQYETSTVKKIRVSNKSLANDILKEIFSFDNILDLEDKYIKIILQNIEKEKLYIALQRTDILIRKKFFQNMSTIESNKLSLSLEKLSYISDIAIKNEQKLILVILKSIIHTGVISLKNLREYYA